MPVKNVLPIVKVGIVVLIAFALLWASYTDTVARFVWQTFSWDALVLRSTNGELHYEVGSEYMNTSHSSLYDLNRAELFLRRAAVLDPQLPFVYHELARVLFLKGEFNEALTYGNLQVLLHGDEHPNAYYVRGLIQGFWGNYSEAVTDYEHFLRAYPTNWAGLNDYAWVLLKDKRWGDALDTINYGLIFWPQNPWLLNSKATALFELDRLDEAQQTALQAEEAVSRLTESDWDKAYPGNDPLIAADGVVAFKKAVRENIHMITRAIETGQKTVQ